MSEENTILNFQAGTEDAGKRLDAFLSEKIENWSRSRLQRLVDDGDATVNQNQAKSSYKLRAEDKIEVKLTETFIEKFEPENIPLEIIFEDESLAVINKRAGMITHPGAGAPNGTLANAIAYRFKIQDSEFKIKDTISDISNPKSKIQNPKSRIGIVHRLDKDTSGLIVVAKNETIHEALSAQFRNREVYKSYVALSHGEIERNTGKIDAPIARDKHNRLKMSVQKSGRNALSLWKARQRFEKFTLLDVEIKTGRTHQIRVHLSYINHPIVGDETYNSGRDNTVADLQIRHAIKELNRFFLHAERLSFTHPLTKEKIDFHAPLPKALKDFLTLI